MVTEPSSRTDWLQIVCNADAAVHAVALVHGRFPASDALSRRVGLDRRWREVPLAARGDQFERRHRIATLGWRCDRVNAGGLT
jgi:hypothetical protein